MNKHTVTILTKMCECVGVKFEDVDFTASQWYLEHEWTHEQQDNFSLWLQEWLKSNKNEFKVLTDWSITSNSTIKKFAEEFVLNYGWKVVK